MRNDGQKKKSTNIQSGCGFVSPQMVGFFMFDRYYGHTRKKTLIILMELIEFVKYLNMKRNLNLNWSRAKFH